MQRRRDRPKLDGTEQGHHVLHRTDRHQHHAIALAHAKPVVQRGAAAHLLAQLWIGVAKQAIHHPLALRKPIRRPVQHVPCGHIACRHRASWDGEFPFAQPFV